jgi:hypothetical protein
MSITPRIERLGENIAKVITGRKFVFDEDKTRQELRRLGVLVADGESLNAALWRKGYTADWVFKIEVNKSTGLKAAAWLVEQKLGADELNLERTAWDDHDYLTGYGEPYDATKRYRFLMPEMIIQNRYGTSINSLQAHTFAPVLRASYWDIYKTPGIQQLAAVDTNLLKWLEPDILVALDCLDYEEYLDPRWVEEMLQFKMEIVSTQVLGSVMRSYTSSSGATSTTADWDGNTSTATGTYSSNGFVIQYASNTKTWK